VLYVQSYAVALGSLIQHVAVHEDAPHVVVCLKNVSCEHRQLARRRAMAMVTGDSYLPLPKVVGSTAVSMLQKLHDGERRFRVQARISQSIRLQEEGFE
jgi:hypothetical protein